jgi:hypothetical protein
VPTARALHAGRQVASPLRVADQELGAAAWIAKHQGFLSALGARVRAIFGALGGFQLVLLKHLVSGQKIDGTQHTEP